MGWDGECIFVFPSIFFKKKKDLRGGPMQIGTMAEV